MLEIKGLSVSYGANNVYRNFDLCVDDGKLTCILGESGCGKTTLLNCIAGLVRYGGVITPVNAAYVFQSHRLVPNLTVLKNLTLVGADALEAEELLAAVGLGDKKNSYPAALSGGERQRVALCRAFLYPSDVMLLDEPFSSLDIKTRLQIMKLFADLSSERSSTVLMVTHDVDEALFLADTVIVMGRGEVKARFENTAKGQYGLSVPLREQIIKELTK